MKILSISFLYIWFNALVYGQEYAVTHIPDELKKQADAVIRLSETRFEIENEEMAVYKIKQAITILKEGGEGWGEFIEFYDKLDKIRKIKITLYDAQGEIVKKVKASEIEDIGYTSSGSLYDDIRMKAFAPYHIERPYTIEVAFEKVKRSSFYYPAWNMRSATALAVQQATLIVQTPADYGLRYRQFDYEGEPEISENNGIMTFKWQVARLRAIEQEFRGPEVSQRSPRVILAPTRFSMEGYPGTMETWKDLGLWMKKLNQGRDQLTPEVQAKVKALVSSTTDTREKIRLVYEYLQANTRYVSIQLGIGGFQTFDAKSVCENGYGDCKALTNFTYSMLKSIGIKSYYTLVRAGYGEDDILTDFPSNQFNHAILSVPIAQDTVWLECTDQEIPFNFLGGFTSDRHVLMITDEGGKLVKTPDYPVEQNTRIRHTKVTFDHEGNARAAIETRYKGRRYDDSYLIVKKGKESQRKYLLNSIDIPAFDLIDFSYLEEKSEDPLLTARVELSLRRYGTTSGKRLFFVPNLMNRLTYVPPKDENRESPIINKYAYTDIDSVTFSIPENYRLEFEPEPIAYESEFGAYKVSYSVDPETNELTYVRYIRMHKGRFPPDTYEDYRNFRKKISRTDRSKLVLIGET